MVTDDPEIHATPTGVSRELLRPLSDVGLTDSTVWGLVDAAPDGIMLADDDGRILLVNRKMEELFGYDRGDLLGRSVDARHEVRLVVDGKPSGAGPTLVLNGLDYCSAAMTQPPCFPTAVGDPYPPILVTRYGTGHTIVLQYAARGGS